MFLRVVLVFCSKFSLCLLYVGGLNCGGQSGDPSFLDLTVALTSRVRMKEAPENLQEVVRDPTM